MLMEAERDETTLNTGTRLAIERTRKAYDRTMMAWVRTATSLISFGFTIYKFFQLELQKNQGNGRMIGPREFGLTLVSIGLVSLLLATLENRRDMRSLRDFYPVMPRSMATLLAALIALMGIAAMTVMLIRA